MAFEPLRLLGADEHDLPADLGEALQLVQHGGVGVGSQQSACSGEPRPAVRKRQRFGPRRNDANARQTAPKQLRKSRRGLDGDQRRASLRQRLLPGQTETM
jgi:hypothetical protein